MTGSNCDIESGCFFLTAASNVAHCAASLKRVSNSKSMSRLHITLIASPRGRSYETWDRYVSDTQYN